MLLLSLSRIIMSHLDCHNNMFRLKQSWLAFKSPIALLWLVVFCAILAGLVQTAFADRVGIRVDRQPGLVRLLLDWPRPVVYSRRAQFNTTVISFDREIDARWGNVKSVLSEVLKSYEISEDKLSLILTPHKDISVRTYSDGPSVVIDFVGDNIAMDLREVKVDGEDYEAPPSDAPTVAIIGASTEDKTRVVLQWPTPQPVSLNREGSSLTLTYKTYAKADRSRIAPPVLHSLNLVTVLTESPRLVVELDIPEDARVEQFNVENSNVIDIFKPLDKNIEREIAATETGNSTLDRSSLSDDAIQGSYFLAPTARVTKDIEERSFVDKNLEKKEEDETPEDEIDEETGITDVNTENTSETVITTLVSPTKSLSEATGDTIFVDIGAPAATSIFNLGDHLWFVVDKKFKASVPDVFANLIFYLNSGEELDHPTSTVVRFKNPTNQKFRVRREGTVWSLTPIADEEEPLFDIPIATDPRYALGARVIIETNAPEKFVSFFDPDLRETLYVTPLKPGGQAVQKLHAFADFKIEPSFQGVVIRPINLDIILERTQIGVIVSAPNGLKLSDERPQTTVQTDEVVAIDSEGDVFSEARTLIDPEKWARGGRRNFAKYHGRLLNELMTAEADKVNAFRLRLAQFLFGHGLFHEALGVLNLMIDAEPDIKRRPAIIGLQAAALTMIGRSQEALEIFEHPEFITSKGLELWRGVAYADTKRWEEAGKIFRDNEGLIQRMPLPLVSIIGLMAIETYVEMKWISRALDFSSFLISEYPDWAYGNAKLVYLSARASLLRGDRKQAIEFLKVAATSEDRFMRLRAGMLLVSLQLQENDVKPETAAAHLERIRFAWRGDQHELALLERLGELHIEGKNYSDGFSAWRYAVNAFPNDPKAEELSQRLYETFKAVLSTKYIDEDVDSIAILKLFNDYQELTPPGREGDVIVLSLISRLIQIDLLHDAADLLEHQALNRSQGVTRKRMGTQLAALRLLDNRPELALEALKIGGKIRVSRTLEEERSLLRARALSDLGEIDQAFEALRMSDSRDSELLKVDIAWRAQDWPRVVEGLNSILPPPPPANQPIDPELSSILLNLAVANAILDNKDELAVLRSLYGLAMDSGPDAATFRLITRGGAMSSIETLKDIETRINETDIFSSFLENIKDRALLPNEES